MAQVIYSKHCEHRLKNKFTNISEGGLHVIDINELSISLNGFVVHCPCRVFCLGWQSC